MTEAPAARRPLIAIGVAVIVVGVGALGIGVVWLAQAGDGSSTASTALDAARPAVAPFTGLTATHIAIGGRPLHVVIADDAAERDHGLRRRHTIGTYDGMLFVYASDSTDRYTMATVPVPLDIAFYAADGRVVTRLRMPACPTGTDATCPTYAARAPYRLALETLAGNLPTGRLGSPR